MNGFASRHDIKSSSLSALLDFDWDSNNNDLINQLENCKIVKAVSVTSHGVRSADG